MTKRRKKNENLGIVKNGQAPEQIPKKAAKRPVEAKTRAQKNYIAAIKNNDLTFGIGPAGTGKTFICTALAANELRLENIEKIIVTRPAIEAGDYLGFLPGEMDEKFDPYFRPVKAILEERLGTGYTEYCMKHGKIEAMPFAYMRGMTFKNAWVILDEAQNATVEQMKMFLTRIGENTKIIINGDPSQRDIDGVVGVVDAMKRLDGIKGVAMCQFEKDDVVRSGLAREIILRYDSDYNNASLDTQDEPDDADYEGVFRTILADAGAGKDSSRSGEAPSSGLRSGSLQGQMV